jgi:hypothetical protein
VSIDVFRAAALAIVLTLALGPNASVLCAVWCHPEDVTAGACEHPNPTSTAGITANDSCPDIATASTAVVREDVRRGVSAADQDAAVVPPFQLVPPPNSPEFGREPRQHPPLDARPLVLSLRI